MFSVSAMCMDSGEGGIRRTEYGQLLFRQSSLAVSLLDLGHGGMVRGSKKKRSGRRKDGGE